MKCSLDVCAGAGLYNETAFRGLDFVLDQASQYGVKVMFTLANNWKTFDSKYNVSPTSAEPFCHVFATWHKNVPCITLCQLGGWTWAACKLLTPLATLSGTPCSCVI